MTTQSRSGRRYVARFLTAAIVYTVLLPICITLSQRQPEGSLPRYVLACLPVIGVGLGVWALWRYIQEVDEFQARKLLDALALSLAGTLVVTFLVGMVQAAGGPALSWVWVIPVWAVFLAVGSIWANRKYR